MLPEHATSRSASPVQLFASPEPLAHVTRSGEVESLHRGSVAVADATGRLIAHAGDPGLPVFWRSAAKLHQALPLIAGGGLARWHFSGEQLAIMCGSHNGEPAQVECVRSILQHIGLGPEALHCGAQEPYGSAAAKDLIRHDEKPGPLHNTCSGNHAGLLALAQLLGRASEPYEPIANAVQQRALEVVATFAGLPAGEIFTGIDGCGIPAYRTPLSALAVAFARLVAPPVDWAPALRKGAATVVQAV